MSFIGAWNWANIRLQQTAGRSPQLLRHALSLVKDQKLPTIVGVKIGSKKRK